MANEFIARKGYIALEDSQITGSLSITGNITGSTFSGSFVGDGSQLGGVTTASYVEYNDIANKPTLVSGSEQISFNGITDKPTLVSGSSQITYSDLTGIPSGIVSGSSQVVYSGLTGIPSGIVSGSSQVTYSGLTGIPSGIVSGSAQIAALGYATTGSNTFQSNQTITGSLFITQNLIVGGSSSIQYISSSVVDIADNIITVNAFNPGVRFGGLAVADSGSSPRVSGSMLFDSIRDQWIFVHENQTVITSSVVLMGPETYNDLGNETYLTANRLPKGSGIEHLRDSNITDTGTLVTINSNTGITGSFTVITGSAVELQVTNLGVNLGSALTDSHIISGSLTVNPNGLFVSGSGNVGIGTTSPLGLLHITPPSVTGTRVDGLRLSKSLTNAANYLAFQQGGNGWRMGINYNDGAYPLVFLYGASTPTAESPGSEFVRITSGGNVGIGTTSPSARLHVEIDSASEVDVARFRTINGADNQFLDISVDNTNNFVAYDASGATAGAHIFRAGGTERLRIASDGSVGIGTTSPIDKLNIAGGVTFTSTLSNPSNTSVGSLQVGYDGTQGVIQTWNSSPLLVSTYNYQAFSISGTERMRITAAGAVAIGATSTNGRLGVRGTTTDSSAYAFEAANSSGNSLFLVRNDGRVGVGSGAPNGSYSLTLAGDSSGYTGGIVFKQSSTDTFYIGNPSTSNTTDFEFWNPRNGYTRFATNNTERMRIAAGGSVGIGETSPSNGALSVKADWPSGYSTVKVYPSTAFSSSSTAGYGIFDSNGSTRQVVLAANNTQVDLNVTANKPLLISTNDAERMRVTANGEVAIGSTSASRGRLYVNSGANTDVVALQNTLNTGAFLTFADCVTPTWDNAPRLGAVCNDMAFRTLATDRVRITSAGNVGINTTSPSSLLSVCSTTACSTVVDVQGCAGQLFSVTDNLVGEIFAVSDISGIPILSVNSNGTVSVDSKIAVGANHTVSGAYASVTGGRCNTASGAFSTIGGGGGQITCAGVPVNAGNTASGACSTIGGGICNNAVGEATFIGGGRGNTASSYYTTVAGGLNNSSQVFYSTVGGGFCNTASSYYSSILGGMCNTACGNTSTVGGGFRNIASGYTSMVGGGNNNTASGYAASVLGGRCGVASATFSAVGNGNAQTASSCNEFRVSFLSKASGTFRINHPDPSKQHTHYLSHSFVESPTAGDNIYRYKVNVINGTAVVNLPSYYKYLNENDQIWVTPQGHFGIGYGTVNTEQTQLTIYGNTDGEYNVLLIGTRKDTDAVEHWQGTETYK